MTATGDGYDSDIDGASYRILPFVTDRGDRRVLTEWLSDRYDLVSPEDPLERLRSDDVDLCILDRRSFETHRDPLIERKEAESPRMLPYLFVRRTDVPSTESESRRYIDEVITTPISQRELTLRVESLLRTRALSCEVARKNERLEYFLNAAAHDLRNPLSIAKGYAELIDDPASTEIENALNRIGHLVENFLSINRSERVSEADVEPVAFRTLVEGCWELVPTADATFEVAIDEETSVRAIPGLLRQLIENLLRNAVEHGGDDVEIRIGTLADGEGFYFEDDGSGIPEAKRKAVFEAGYSTNAGSGLGLMITQRIVDTHGWEIRVTESKASGARFEITSVELEA